MKVYFTAIGLFTVTALAEIFGCYTFYLWLTLKKSPLWLVPGVASLALFAWLLTLHPTAAGRTYAAYGGIYIAASLAWLKFVDGQSPDRWDVLGALVCLTGAAIILFPHLKTIATN
ncbi:MAG: YnfA family protein [Verrucomicrobiae bacterium]|nr:YnfA family protein [Verrucomicrobiae bacterium]